MIIAKQTFHVVKDGGHRPHTGQSSQLFVDHNYRNAQFPPTPDQALPRAGADAPICDAVFVVELEPLDTVSKRLVVQLLISEDVVELETEHFECAPYVRACDCSVADLRIS